MTEHRWQSWPNRPGIQFCPDCPAWRIDPDIELKPFPTFGAFDDDADTATP